ncbi:MAG: hypothetical protein RL141_121 [Candidatus Parcubacteria bacterium]|jgi:GNAT superfamily N-acetyltransferase
MEFHREEIRTGLVAIKFSIQEGDLVIGWAYLYVLKNDRHPEPYGFLENVYIEKAFRGKGIGTRFIRDVIEEAKKQGCYKLIGNSRTSNESAHAFYERFGFRKHGFEFRMDLIDSKPLQQD